MRCIEIPILPVERMKNLEINSNMRCIEIDQAGKNRSDQQDKQ